MTDPEWVKRFHGDRLFRVERRHFRDALLRMSRVSTGYMVIRRGVVLAAFEAGPTVRSNAYWPRPAAFDRRRADVRDWR